MVDMPRQNVFVSLEHGTKYFFVGDIRISFSASEVTTIWRYTNVYIIIIIIINDAEKMC